MTLRQSTLLEQLICGFDTALRTLYVPEERVSARVNPGAAYPEASMSLQEKRHIAGLMRVNHSGEVCAQALYQGEAATAKHEHVKAQMSQAAKEEIDHLAWCEQRLRELDAYPSQFNHVWYWGSFFLGAIAGLLGDRWSLGFVAETEQQVTSHLEGHVQKLPPRDLKTQAILKQMQEDERHHAQWAIQAGGRELPWLIKQCMRHVSKIMTSITYYR